MKIALNTNSGLHFTAHKGPKSPADLATRISRKLWEPYIKAEDTGRTDEIIKGQNPEDKRKRDEARRLARR